jgi:DNA-binding NarL/FixJ family response regulator
VITVERIKILIADDEVPLTKVAKRVIERHIPEVEVLQANDIDMALHIIFNEELRVVISDHDFRDKAQRTGALIAEAAQAREIPFVSATSHYPSYALPELYLPKAYLPETLVQMVRAVLQGYPESP